MVTVRAIVVLVSTLLLGAGILSSPIVLPIHRVAAATDTIVLTGFVAAWNNTSHPNPTITVTQGDMVTLQLSSGDGALHRWFVDVDKNGPTPDCPGADFCSNAFSTTTTFTFTVSFAPGTYTYYCSVHPATMLGSFVVNPSSSVGGASLPVNKPQLIAPYLGLAAALAFLATVIVYTTRARRWKNQSGNPLLAHPCSWVRV